MNWNRFKSSSSPSLDEPVPVTLVTPPAPLEAISVEEVSRREIQTLRQSSTLPAEIGEAEFNLAVEAEEVLGYKGISNKLKLEKTLRKLEIGVLDTKEVNQYMAAKQKPGWSWNYTPIQKFPFPIPQFVLRKAIQLKKELPEAHLVVVHLAFDPFLAISLGNQTCYIEVWDESDFEGRNTKGGK